ncbi:MAG: Mth938-like domain-containing protein [Betaproteobacteria bacterium]
MKLHLNTADGQNSISGHGPGFVMVNTVVNEARQTVRLESSAIIMPVQLISPWPLAEPPAVGPGDFALLLALKPEVVLFGCGAAFHFPDARIMAAFSQARIGFDVMDTPAACRTFNILISEGRNVAAALLIADAGL